MSSWNVSLSPPDPPAPTPLSPKRTLKPVSIPTTLPMSSSSLSLGSAPEGFLNRFRKRTPSSPKSSKQTPSTNNHPMADDLHDLSHTGLVFVDNRSSSSTEKLSSPPKATLFGKLSAVLSISGSPRPASPTPQVEEERTSTSTIRPFLQATSDGKDRDTNSCRNAPSSSREGKSTRPPTPPDLGLRPSVEKKVFQYADDVLSRARRPSRSLRRSLNPPPPGPLPPLPTDATPAPVSIFTPSSSPYSIPSDHLDILSMSRPEIERELVDARQKIGKMQLACAAEVEKHTRCMQKMQRTIDGLHVEIGKLRTEGAERIGTWSIAPQKDDNVSEHYETVHMPLSKGIDLFDN